MGPVMVGTAAVRATAEQPGRHDFSTRIQSVTDVAAPVRERRVRDEQTGSVNDRAQVLLDVTTAGRGGGDVRQGTQVRGAPVDIVRHEEEAIRGTEALDGFRHRLQDVAPRVHTELGDELRPRSSHRAAR